jgi:hypothetical protein
MTISLLSFGVNIDAFAFPLIRIVCFVIFVAAEAWLRPIQREAQRWPPVM